MKKRIRFFINTLAGAGAEKVLIDLLKQLEPDKYDLSLLTITGGIHANNVPSYVQYKTLIKNPKTKRSVLWRKILFHIPPKLFAKLFLKGKYDIEISYLEGRPTRCIAALRTEAKKIAFVHCDVSVKPILQKIYKTVEHCHIEYEKFNKVCFVSNRALEGFQRIFGELNNAVVVHNIINAKENEEKAKEDNNFEFQTNGTKLISVGRLSPEKGYERLIYIASCLEKKFDFELCILGDGEEREKLEILIKKLNINSVKLLGFQKNPYSYMKKADLYICPSFYEGYSTTVTESIMLGIPVLTTDCAGMEEIIGDSKCGIIVENSTDGLLEGLENILRSKKYVQMKEMAKERASWFDIENQLIEFVTMLND